MYSDNLPDCKLNRKTNIKERNIMITSYTLNPLNTQQLNQIKELSDFLKNEAPTNEQQLLNHKERLITFLDHDYSWLCAEYENISKLIEENNKAIREDPDHKNDALYSKRYDLYYFYKYYILAPHNLLSAAHSYQFGFGNEFIKCIDNFKSKNKDILDLTKPKFPFIEN